MKRLLHIGRTRFLASAYKQACQRSAYRKRSWLITIIICLVILGGGGAVLLLPQVVPFGQCSDVYKKYADMDGVDATFIKDYKVNDTVFVDVTLLVAIDSVGWDILIRDFEVPNLPAELQQLIDNGTDLFFTKSIPKSKTDTSDSPYDLLAISHLKHTLTVFHINSDIEKHAVFNHNYKKETIN